MTGSHNDINVLQRSPVFARLAEGDAPVFNYEINGHPYNKYYYLADGIYPDWSTFVKIFREPAEEKNRRFVKRHKVCRKNVERVFGVLQSRWAIVRHPARRWSTEVMWEVMTACVIMHTLVEKRLLVAHHFGLCVAHMGCATNATPLVTVYQWRISICTTHNLPMRGAYCYMRH
jgi:hypothetical protein